MNKVETRSPQRPVCPPVAPSTERLLVSEGHFQFEFNRKADMTKVEEVMLMAVAAIEGIHGRSRVQYDATYGINHGTRICLVNADNQIGVDLTKVLVEFLNLEVGRYEYRIRRVRGSARSLSGEFV